MNNNILHQNTTEQLLERIRSGKGGRDEVLIALFKDVSLKRNIRSVIVKMGGTVDDADDIFTTTLVQFVKTVLRRSDLVIEHQLHTYIVGIAKFQWLGRIKKNNSARELVQMTFADEMEDNAEMYYIKQGQRELLHDLMQRMGKNCKEVLIHWAMGYSMKEIAVMMNYKSEGMAKKKKYQCFKALIQYLDDNPKLKEALRK